jgi:hypothetical protein
MDDSTADVPGASRAQRTRVAERVDRLRRLSAGLDRMIDAHERGLLLTIEQQAAIFDRALGDAMNAGVTPGGAEANQLLGMDPDTATWE